MNLMARVGEEFPLECPHCGGDIRLTAFIAKPKPFQKILTHLGEALQPPPVSSRHLVDRPPTPASWRKRMTTGTSLRSRRRQNGQEPAEDADLWPAYGGESLVTRSLKPEWYRAACRVGRGEVLHAGAVVRGDAALVELFVQTLANSSCLFHVGCCTHT